MSEQSRRVFTLPLKRRIFPAIRLCLAVFFYHVVWTVGPQSILVSLVVLAGISLMFLEALGRLIPGYPRAILDADGMRLESLYGSSAFTADAMLGWYWHVLKFPDVPENRMLKLVYLEDGNQQERSVPRWFADADGTLEEAVRARLPAMSSPVRRRATT